MDIFILKEKHCHMFTFPKLHLGEITTTGVVVAVAIIILALKTSGGSTRPGKNQNGQAAPANPGYKALVRPINYSMPLAPKDGEAKSRALARHLRDAADNQLAITKDRPLVTGRDVLALGVPPGPEVGRLLEAVAQAQFENPALSREEALELLRKKVGQPSIE